MTNALLSRYLRKGSKAAAATATGSSFYLQDWGSRSLPMSFSLDYHSSSLMALPQAASVAVSAATLKRRRKHSVVSQDDRLMHMSRLRKRASMASQESLPSSYSVTKEEEEDGDSVIVNEGDLSVRSLESLNSVNVNGSERVLLRRKQSEISSCPEDISRPRRPQRPSVRFDRDEDEDAIVVEDVEDVVDASSEGFLSRDDPFVSRDRSSVSRDNPRC